MQIIFHIDLNAFFASAEVTQNPSLKGKPIVVAHDSRRGIVSTASYEARKYGIHSAMPLYQAKEKCRHLVIIEPHFELYHNLSQQFFAIIQTYSDIIEIASIDECYADMTSYIISNDIQPYNLARLIQNKVYDKLNLQCSVGISYNKFLAKMSSDMKKPMGITMITTKNYQSMLWPLPITEMYGIGKKTAPKLMQIGIETIGDLAKYENYEKIKPIFGKNAIIYYQRAHGKDYGKLNVKKGNPKSISHSVTFDNDSHDETYIRSIFYQLSQKISHRAKEQHLVSCNISITLKFDLNHMKTKQMIIDDYTYDYQIIYDTAISLFESIYDGEDLRL
ncbi:MAG: DNA polymerase IV, partial [Erysipelotrichaceae bacterium]|nr:DNA polymerase IV [Erysipelotrichaceae bacterium]